MTESSYSKAMFTGLIFNEEGEPVDSTFIGTEPHYVILDDDFKRHIPAETVDRQVLEWIQQQALSNKDLVSEQIMGMMGKDDLFTKAMIDSSLNNMDQVMNQGIPDDARMMLGMVGFKIVVNVHGEIVNFDVPGQELPEE